MLVSINSAPGERKMGHKTCPETKLVIYPTWLGARFALIRIVSKGNVKQPRAKGVKLVIGRCDHCGKWHLGEKKVIFKKRKREKHKNQFLQL